MPLMLKLALLALAGLTVGILLFVGTGSFFLVGCWCALIANILNEAQHGSHSWLERGTLSALVIGLITVFGPMSL